MEANMATDIISGPLPTGPLQAEEEAEFSERVATIVNAFVSCMMGSSPDCPWTVYELSNVEYDELLWRLGDDEETELYAFVSCEARFNYDPIRSKLAIRMQTPLHRTFAEYIGKEIMTRLESLAKSEVETQPWIKNISWSPDGLMEYAADGKQFRNQSDLKFGHRDGSYWPCVLIEISYSTKTKDLDDLADNCLLYPPKDAINPPTNVMVGIDIDHKNESPRASISLWRSKTWVDDKGEKHRAVIKEIDQEEFRDAQGNPILASSGLQLRLRDFVIEAQSQGPPDCSISIESKRLCELLATAERIQDEEKAMAEKRRNEREAEAVKMHKEGSVIHRSL